MKDILISQRIYQNRDETGIFDKTRSIFSSISVLFLILMAGSQAPYIHVILSDVVSIT